MKIFTACRTRKGFSAINENKLCFAVDSSQEEEPVAAVSINQSPQVRLTVEKLFNSYHGLLMKFIRERVFDQADAEDVAQEVYYRIARKSDLEQITYPKAFLIRTAQNLLIDMNRCGRKVDIRSDMDALELEVDTSEETPGNYALGADLLSTLESALPELSPKCQAVFVMNRIDGISIRQIAVDLNMSKSMVEKYMRQALKHLKNKMEKHYENG